MAKDSVAKRFKVGDYIEIIDVDSCWDGRRARVVEIRAGQPVVAVGDAAAAGMGVLWGNAFNNGRLRKVKHLGRANDNIPEDEMVLAELIQNAAARGLHSTRGRPFGKSVDLDDSCGVGTSEAVSRVTRGDLLESPPPEATCCCALGAATLGPATGLYREPGIADVYVGNDRDDDQALSGRMRYVNIGAAFEQALRPES